MISEGVINIDLYTVSSAVEFDSIIKDITANRYFELKDTKGNRMYSVAMHHYCCSPRKIRKTQKCGITRN